jgi:DNA-binding transcriptional regulator of glucitol operon
MKTQQYQIFKEDEFSERNLKNSSIIVYFTVIQIIILIILTIWQIASFKNVFKDKLNI